MARRTTDSAQRALLMWRGGAVSTLVISVVAACYSAPPPTGGPIDAGPRSAPSCTPDLASITATIFTPSCATSGCHDAKGRSATLDLSKADIGSVLVGVETATCDDDPTVGAQYRVVPGAPDASILFQKISGHTKCGARMPIDAPPLSDAQIECVRGWIDSLVPRDAAASDAADGGSCGDTQTNASNCGTCGNVCPAGASCNAGTCACSGTLAACGTACVDTKTSVTSCGACGTACASGAACANGTCTCPATASAVCNDKCVDLKSDVSNCGACNKACSGGAPFCSNGTCSSSCGDSGVSCNNSCVDTRTSFNNCGTCGTVCPSGATCSAGKCVCPVGQTACNGVCLNTISDSTNCGACGVTCSSGTTCTSGKCACSNGGSVCGGTCVLTSSDTSNCGACGVVCAPGQTCSAGKCTCGSASVSYSGSVQPIFNASCAIAGCHIASKGPDGGAKQGLDLSGALSYGNLVNVLSTQCTDGRMRVKPGAPTESYLIHKLTNQNLCGTGTQMPKKGQSLTTAELATISNWICAGALNN